jgi:hypothetical protein
LITPNDAEKLGILNEEAQPLTPEVDNLPVPKSSKLAVSESTDIVSG